MDKNELSQLRYTSREYLSIFEDLYNAIPALTEKWTSREETDPGIVLIKLMAMLGDMLSYNQDKQSLEVYPATVTQRKNANQIFGLLGYKLHWYQSATCTGVFRSPSGSADSIPPYTAFATSNNIQYSNLSEIRLTTGAVNAVLTQGVPITPPVLSGVTDSTWYAKYDYNILASDIIDNKYYLEKNSPIADGSVFLIDDTGIEWQYPDSSGATQIGLDLEASTGRFFEVNVDEYDTPYIQFPQNWNKAVNGYSAPGRFKLFYLKSAGSAGSINENTLTDSQNRLISNTMSTQGYDPETPEEARINSVKYRNTIDTLITLQDFMNATLRIANVNNCKATDLMTDPYSMNPNTVNLYVIPSAIIENGTDESEKDAFKSSIKEILRDFKCIPVSVDVYLPGDTTSDGLPLITYYDWSPTGEIYLNSPVDSLTAQEILTKINTRLQYVYSTANVEFNTPINYVSLVSEIMEADSRIRYVNLDTVTYNNGSVTPRDITGKLSGVRGEISGSSVLFSNLGRITPGSTIVTAVVNNQRYEIRDYGYPNKNGVGSMATVIYLNRSDPLVNSSIDYTNGTISLQFANSVMDATVSLTQNKIGICRYNNIETSLSDSKLYIAPESLKM